jgi:hypothetical protein
MKTSTRNPDRTPRTRIPVYAGKAELALQSHRGGDEEPTERKVAVNLAELNTRLELLREALDDLLASPRSSAGKRPFPRRMIRLAHEIAGMHDVCANLRKPFNKLVRAQCRKEKEAYTLLALAGSTIKGFARAR